MAINKNFVVKHGLEVNSNLVFADSDTKRVGIKTAIPQHTLDVRGGIGATDISISGIASIAVGVVTDLSGTNISYSGIGTISTLYSNVGVVTSLNVSGVSTVLTEFNVGTGGTVLTALNTGLVGVGTTNPGYALHVIGPATGVGTALYVDGDVRITGDINVDDITFDDATVENITVTDTLLVGSGGGSGIATIGTLGVTGVTTTQHLSVSGITTLGSSNGIGTVTIGIGTTALLVDGNARVIGNLSIGRGTVIIDGVNNTINIGSGTSSIVIDGSTGNISATSITVGVSTFVTTLGVTTATEFISQTINVSGVSTLGTVQVSSGIITAASGIVTYYGDGSFLTGNARNLTATIGIRTEGGVVGTAVSFLDLRGTGISTTLYNSTSGIATIFFQGGGSGSASIGIGTTPGEAFTGIITAGNLWYNSNIGRLFIYYQDTDSSQWVDASPFNIGILTSLNDATISFVPGSAASPSMYFSGDTTTGFFSPSTGQFTVVSSGSSILNVNSGGVNVTGRLNVTGVTTLGSSNGIGTVTVGVGTTALLVDGNARVIGNLSVGRGTITFDGTNNTISVGTSVTIDGATGIISATSINVGVSTFTTTLGVTSTTNLTSQQLSVSGVSTFTNGPVLVGSATSTGTASQRLQVTGGAYVSGNVGVGTTNPQYGLDVVGDINFTGTFRQNGSQFIASRWTSGTGNDIYRLDGDVGIGTTDPTSKLHVVGNVNITGTLSNATLDNVRLLNYSDVVVDGGNTGSAATIFVSNGGYFVYNLNQTTTFTFNTTGIATGAVGFVLQITNGTGGPFSITWPASVRWPAGVTPSRTTTDGRTDIWSFVTTNQGTTWLGNLSIVNYSL